MGNSKQAQPEGGFLRQVSATSNWPADVLQAVRSISIQKPLALPARGSLLLWAPWLFCFGAAAYFYPASEPPVLLPVMVIGASIGALMLLRQQDSAMAAWGGFALGLGIAFAAGWGAAQWHSRAHATPVLDGQSRVYQGRGVVLAVDKERARRARYLVAPERLGWLKPADMPARIRLSAYHGDAEPGQRVRFTAALQAPSSAGFAGDFDFARFAWFSRLGGTGYAYGHIHALADEAKRKAGPGVYMTQMRRTMAQRIEKRIGGQKGAIAAALVTGDRSTITEATAEDLRAAGLAHMLAISGLHMGLVAGLVFAASAMMLAAIPLFGSRFDCRKPAAILGLAVATGYLLLSGASAPTQRAFVMIAIAFMAVLFNRRALSLRTVSLAALVVAVLAPQNVISPGFQMSFAAALALIAFYEWAGSRGKIMPAMAARRPFFMLAYAGAVLRALALTSLIAGLATGPFAAFYFHRTAVYGLAANIVAMPVFTFLVMPSLLAGTLLDSLGAGGPFYAIAGWGLDVIMAIAHTIAQAPGALARIAAAPALVLAIMAAGLLLLSLLHKKKRLIGVPLLLAGAGMWALTSHPDGVLRQSGGALRVIVNGEAKVVGFGDIPRYQLEQFAASLGLAPADVITASKASRHIPCDGSGCTVRLADGRRVVLNRHIGALAEDCRLAGLVLATQTPSPRNRAHCAASQLISPARAQNTMMLLYLNGGTKVRLLPSRSRPWDAARAVHGEMESFDGVKTACPGRNGAPGNLAGWASAATPPAGCFDSIKRFQHTVKRSRMVCQGRRSAPVFQTCAAVPGPCAIATTAP